MTGYASHFVDRQRFAWPRLRPRSLLRVAVLGAIVLGLFAVAHDLCDRFPFWWSAATARQHIMDRLARTRRYDEILAQLPASDPRSLPILLSCLDAEDADIRLAAYHALGQRLDRWQLLDQQAQVAHIAGLVRGFRSQPSDPGRASAQLQRHLATRCLQTLLRIAPQQSERLAECQQLLDATAAPAAREPDANRPSIGQADDPFHLPGGGLPIR